MFYRCVRMLAVSLFLLVIATAANATELNLSELITGIKQSLLEVQKTADPATGVIPWVEGEISYIVKKEGKGGFKLYVVTADAKYATEAVHRVKFRIEPLPGTKWKVEIPGEFNHAFIAGVDRVANKVFVSSSGEGKAVLTFSLKITPDTKIVDASGETQTLAEIHEGTKGTIRYTTEPTGDLQATVITIKK